MTMDTGFATEPSSCCPGCGAALSQYGADARDGERCSACGLPAIVGGPSDPAAENVTGTGFERWCRSLSPRRQAAALGCVIVVIATFLAALSTAAVLIAGRDRAVSPGGSYRAAPAATVTGPPSVRPSTRAPVQRSEDIASRAAESAQAMQMNDLLAASAANGNLLATALQDVSACNDISSAVVTMRAVLKRGATLYYQAFRLETGRLPNGVALKNNLTNALYFSGWTYYYLVEWAQQRQAYGCADPATAAYDAGIAESAKAARAGDEFVRLWNPVAFSLGFELRSGADI